MTVRVIRAASALLLCAAFACDDQGKKPPSVTAERSQGVIATATHSAAPAPAPSPKKVGPQRSLCAGQLDLPGRDFPDDPRPARVTSAGAAELPATLVTRGAWTWVNLWAAWCVPCKEEIPLLTAWPAKTGGKLRVAFVSLDDDRRQLDELLAAKPGTGIAATWWLEDGKERGKWMRGCGFSDGDPALPVQLLVDPQGKIRCTVKGSVDDGDLAEVQKIIAG